MKKGDTVHWNWGANEAEGKVKQIIKKTVTKTIKGAKVKRNGSVDDAAVVVEQKDGDIALKSESELKMGRKS